MLRRYRKRQDSQRGATMVEFAVSIVVVIFVVFWTFELVMAVYTYAVLSDAAKEGVRYAIVHGSSSSNCSGPTAGCGDSTGANVVAVVRDYAKYTLHDVSGMTVVVSYPESSSAPQSLVTVKVTYNYIPWTILPWTPPALKAGAQGRIVW